MKLEIDRTLGIVGILCVVTGAFLPWATWGSISIAGIEGDGRVTLLLGIVAGVLLVGFPGGKRSACGSLLGFLIALIGCYDALDVTRIAPFGIRARVGVGLFGTIAGGLIMVASGIISLRKRKLPRT